METRIDEKQRGSTPEGGILRRARGLVLARLIAAGMTFFIPLVLARSLSLAEYGTYKQLVLIAQTLYWVLPFGIAQSLFFFLPRAHTSRVFLGQTLLCLAGAGALAAAFIGAALPSLSLLFDNPALAAHRPWLMLYALGLIGGYPLEGALTAQGRTRAAAVSYVTSDLIRTAVMVAPPLLGASLQTLLQGMAAFALCRWAAAWLVLVAFGRGPLLGAAELRAQWRHALPLGLATLLFVAQQYAHQYAVSALFSPEQFALYAVACFQLPLADLFYTPVSEVLMVRLGELERAGRGREAAACFRDVVGRLAWFFFPAAAFFCVAAPDFITALFGSRYLPAAELFRVTALGLALSCLPLEAALRGSGRTGELLRASLLRVALTAPLLFLGIRFFGPAGALASLAVTEVCGIGWLVTRLRTAWAGEDGPPRLAELLPAAELTRAALASAAAGLGLWAMRQATGALGAGSTGGLLIRALPLALDALIFSAAFLALLGWRRVAAVAQGRPA